MADIQIPYKPREVMQPFHDRTERFACLVAHRRCGKTVAAVNDLIRDALTIDRRDVRVAYIAPYYNQAKSIAWDYAKYYSQNIPGIKINESELRIDYPTGGRLRLFGADNYNAMRGLYFDAVVLDEPADFPVSAWPEVIRPALSDRKGKCVFIGTPKGRNEFWETYNLARNDDAWYCAVHRASDTGYVDQEELDDARKVMGEDRYEQEFECSFEAAIQGSYYGTEMKAAMTEGRITKVRYNKAQGVITSWDLGVGDSTSIFFAQAQPNGAIHIIDYYESSGVGLDHYARVLQEKGYVYEQHILPHDVQVKELGTGKSRLEVLDELGIRPVIIAPKLRVDDGIQAVRSMLDQCWFDEAKCERGLEALRQYCRDFDEKGKTWRANPKHDWTSHAADSFRYLAVGYRPVMNSWGEPIRRSIKGVA